MPGRGPQVSDPDRDHPGATWSRLPPGSLVRWTGRKQHGRIKRHEGLPDQKGVSTSSPTGSPARKPVTTGKTVTACPAGTIRPPIQPAQESRNVTASAAPNPTVKTPIYMALAQGRFRYVFHKVSACETGGV